MLVSSLLPLRNVGEETRNECLGSCRKAVVLKSLSLVCAGNVDTVHHSPISSESQSQAFVMNPLALQLAKIQIEQVAVQHAKTVLNQNDQTNETSLSKTDAKMQSLKSQTTQQKKLKDRMKLSLRSKIERTFAPSCDREDSTKAFQMVISQSLLQTRGVAMGRC